MEIYKLLTGYEKFSSDNHSDYWDETIKKSIQQYGEQDTIEGWNTFYKKETNKEKRFWSIMIEMQKRKDIFYDIKKEFYDENLAKISINEDIRDWFFTLDYKVVKYMYDNCSTYFPGSMNIRLRIYDKSNCKRYGDVSEIEYQNILYIIIFNNYENRYKEFYGFAL